MMWRFRVRNAQGASKVIEADAGLGPESTVAQLFLHVQNLFGLKEGGFSIRFGMHHPHVLATSDGGKTLANAGLTDQEVLSVLISMPISAVTEDEGLPAPNRKKKKARVAKDDDTDEDDHSLSSLVSDEDDGEDAARILGASSKRKSLKTKAKASKPPPIKVRRPKHTIKNESDLAEKLASAAANESKDSAAKAFRKLMKNEVIKQHERDAALVKLAAVQSGNYEITQSVDSSSYRLADGVPMEFKLTVKYRKGPRTFATEEVQGFGEEVLKAVIEEVLNEPEAAGADDALDHPRENLRPTLLPLMAPRVFWSLVHLKGGGNDCIEKGFRSLLPNRDWGFLDTRVRRRTAKAKAWEQTERALDADDRGEIVSSDDEEAEDEFAHVVPTIEGRRKLKQLKIMTVLGLADVQNVTDMEGVDEQWIENARQTLVERFTGNILENDGDIISKLSLLDIKTPMDISRLRIPGRTEFVVQELGVAGDLVERWRMKADVLLRRHQWLDSYRTRG